MTGERVARISIIQDAGWAEPAKPIISIKCNLWVSRRLSSGAHSRDPLAPPILRAILVQVRAANPSWKSAAARALRPFGFDMWLSLSLSMLRGMRVQPEGRIDREWAQSLPASRTPAVRRP